MQNKLYDVYREEGEAAGHALAPGEGLGLLRDVIVAETDEEAIQLWRHGAAFCGAAWFTPFHFNDVLREPGRDDDPSIDELMANGSILVGSVDTVTQQMERLLELTPVRWIFAWQYNGLVAHDKLMHSIELFATKVLPRFDGAPD